MTEEEYLKLFTPQLATGLALKKLCEINNVEYNEEDPDSYTRFKLLKYLKEGKVEEED